VLFVSHARTFVNALADQIYEIRGGTLRHYTGTYEEYVDDLAAIMDEIADTPQVTDSNDEKKRENRALLKEKQRLQERVNQGIVKLDKEKSTLLAYFFENPLDYSPEKSQRLNELTEEIEKEERIWLKLQDEIDKLR
jgi:ATPase subunit of ABC transporter with duplicated ATPase domains